jgi:hypothetical protein
MGRTDIIYSVILLMLSAGTYALTFSFPRITVALSPTVFPRFVAGGMFVLSLILLVQGISRQVKGAGGAHAQAAADRSFVVRFILLFADAAAYVLLLGPVGYIVATPLCIAVAMLLFGDRTWYRILVTSLLCTVVMYAVFRVLFRVPLPRSFFW